MNAGGADRSPESDGDANDSSDDFSSDDENERGTSSGTVLGDAGNGSDFSSDDDFISDDDHDDHSLGYFGTCTPRKETEGDNFSGGDNGDEFSSEEDADGFDDCKRQRDEDGAWADVAGGRAGGSQAQGRLPNARAAGFFESPKMAESDFSDESFD